MGITRLIPLPKGGVLLVLLLSLILPVSLWGGIAQAQTSSNSDAESGAGASRADVIPISDIINRANEDQGILLRVSRKLKEKTPEELLGPSLKDISTSIEEKKSTFYREQLRNLPVARLESLDRHWQFDARRFARWQSDMRDISAPYTKLADELSQRYAEWAATKAAFTEESLPKALAIQIDTMLTDIRAAENKLSAPLAQLGSLARRAGAVDASIQTGRSDVAAAIETIDRRLFQTDAEPLWRMEFWRNASENSLQSIEHGLDIEARFAKDYSAGKAGSIQGVRVIQIALLILLLWLARLYSRTPSLAGDESTARILKRPLSSWLLLSMLITLAFETSAPLVLMEFTLLVAFIPLLRLLPQQSLRLLDFWPYAVIGLYVLDRFSFLLMDNSYLYRLFVLGLAVIALAVTLWLQWRWRHHERASTPLRVRVRIVGWLTVVLLSVSIVVNCIGNVSLADMLVGGLIDSSYMGLLLYTGVMVCAALLKVLIAQPSISTLMFMRMQAAAIQQMLMRGLIIAASLAWAIYTMDRFRILRPVYAWFRDFLAFTVELGEISISVGNVLAFIISVLIAFWSASLVRLLLREQLLAHVSLPRGVGHSIASLSYYAVLILGFLIALSAAGFKVGQLALMFGALGVGIGLGLQNIVSNFVSGLVLMFERPIQPGDIIDLPGVSGRVRQIGMRATIISTFDGADVVVPNGTLVSNNLTNWTLMDSRRRIDLTIGVAYGTDVQKLLPILVETTRAMEGISDEPAPVALMTGYGVSSLDFVVRAWTYDIDNWMQIRSNLFASILTALNEAEIEIPFSQHDLHLRSVSPEAEAALQRFGAPAKDVSEAAEVGSPAPIKPSSDPQSPS